MGREKIYEHKLFLICFVLSRCAPWVNAQFEVEALQSFLEQNENLNADGLLANYPADRIFDSAVPPDLDSSEFLNIVDTHIVSDERSERTSAPTRLRRDRAHNILVSPKHSADNMSMKRDLTQC